MFGGKDGASTRLTLYADPVVNTALGNISYPGEIKIVDRSYTINKLFNIYLEIDWYSRIACQI